MFGINATEFILLIVIAVIMFGPEKIPEFSRKAARLFVTMRDLANNAQAQLRNELGPEYADLQLSDLNPKTFVAKHMREEMELIEEAKKDIDTAGKSVSEATKEAKKQASDAQTAAKAKPKAKAKAAIAEAPLKFDDEAT